jgi:hypothetical protein
MTVVGGGFVVELDVMVLVGKRVMLAVCEAGMEVMTPLMAVMMMCVSLAGGHMMDVTVVFWSGIGCIATAVVVVGGGGVAESNVKKECL